MALNPYRQYQTTQVQTASAAQLTLMCYDGILRALAQGREAMLAKRYDVQNATIDKAQALIGELLKGLDYERGGEIAANLDGLYRYLYDRLSHANLRDDVAALDEVRTFVSDLRDAWATAMSAAGAAGVTPATAESRPREFALSA
jgi:flagellar protein FliS